MVLVSKSVDEMTAELADIYDDLIKPKKIWRDHNNKLYLILRACAAGITGVTDAALALRNRFDPRYCEEADLYSAAKITGTDFRHGTGSIADITVKNNDSANLKILREGVYNFQSSSGMIFSFQLSGAAAFEPGEERVISAISREKGAFPVMYNTNIMLFRSDSAKIDGSFSFACDDNSGRLGYPDETPGDFRARILNEPDRQDHLKELELRIRNLPNIFECNLVFNEGTGPQEYDGMTLAAKELLIIITGVPTDAVAKLAAEKVPYLTHQVNPENVVYFYNDIYINGKYPVYYKFHDKTDFSLHFAYEYDGGKIKPQQFEDAVRALFKPYTKAVTHIDIFGESDVYRLLDGLNLPGVTILNAVISDDAGTEAPFIRIPKTRLPNLTGITFTATDTGVRE